MKWVNFVILGLVLIEMGAGNSMFPVLNQGDHFIINTELDPQVNDIVMFKYGNEFYAHRVMSAHYNEHTDGIYRTKGDNENVMDQALILRKNIVGVVIWIFQENKQCLI